MMQYQGQQRYNYTVDTFLQAAGTCRTRKHGAPQGYQWDHIVELQLVVAAVNRLPTNTYQNRMNGDWQRELAMFFKEEANYQMLTALENQEKSQAIGRRITGITYPGDYRWINMVGQKWRTMRQSLMQRHDFALADHMADGRGPQVENRWHTGKND